MCDCNCGQGKSKVELPGDLIADINGDGCVDEADLDLLIASFGLKAGDPGYNPRADLNGDHIVNVLDYNILRSQWHQGNCAKAQD